MRRLPLVLSLVFAVPLFADSSSLVVSAPDITDTGASGNIVLNVDVRQPILGDASGVTADVAFSPGFTFVAAHGADCAPQADVIRCTLPTITSGNDVRFDVVATPPAKVGHFFASITATRPSPYAVTTASAQITLYDRFDVTTTADDGAGSLRAAINASNAVCVVGHPCRIAFAFTEPPGTLGWYRVEPQSPLPPVDAFELILDGTYRNTIPVEIRGSRSFGEGLVIRGNSVTVNGLSITGSWANGILADGGNGFVISNNTIGADPVGNVIPNGLRGITVAHGSGTIVANEIRGNRRSGIFVTANLPQKILANRIIDNGASGIYVGPVTYPVEIDGNVISGNHDFAIGTDTNVLRVAVRQFNSMFDNGAPFDIGMDGPGVVRHQDLAPSPAAPTIVSARYDAAHGDTIITVVVNPTPVFNSDSYSVYLFRNRGLDRDGRAEAEAELAGRPATPNTPTVFVLHVDLRGQYITAMTVRSEAVEEPDDASSELSDGVLVQ